MRLVRDTATFVALLALWLLAALVDSAAFDRWLRLVL